MADTFSRVFIMFGFLMLAATAPASADPGKTNDPEFGDPYDTLILDTDFIDQTFEIHVSVPPHEPGTLLPVVYFADDDSLFGILPFMGNCCLTSAGVPPAIYVGIGYPGNSRTSDWVTHRLRDFISPAFEGESSRPDLGSNGTGAPEFLAFIQQDLIPVIEANYPVLPGDRTYFGYSGGSMFGLYVMAHQPETFSRYILGSAFYPESIQELKTYVDAGNSVHARLFIGVGLDEQVENCCQTDMVSDFYDFVAFLQKEDIDGLRWYHEAFPNEVHATNWIQVFMHGMRAVFVDPVCKPYLSAPDDPCERPASGN